MAVGGARLGGLQQLQMPPREDLNLPEEGPPESARAGAGAETPPEGTEQEVSLDKFGRGRRHSPAVAGRVGGHSLC